MSDDLEKIQALTFTLIDTIIQQKTRPAIAMTTLVTLLVGMVIDKAEDEADAWEGLRLIEQGVRMQFAEILKRRFS